MTLNKTFLIKRYRERCLYVLCAWSIDQDLCLTPLKHCLETSDVHWQQTSILFRTGVRCPSPLQQLEAYLEICNCFGLSQVLCNVPGLRPWSKPSKLLKYVCICDRFIESFRLEKTFNLIKFNLTLPNPPLNHVPKHHIYTSFKHLCGL